MDRRLQQRVRSRAANCCEYCQLSQSAIAGRLAIDHIVPRKHGGADTASNLALSCPFCNCHKGTDLTGLDPRTGELSRLFNPRKDVWARNFMWDGYIVRGLTAIGRTTVTVLQMNHPYQLDIRRRA